LPASPPPHIQRQLIAALFAAFFCLARSDLPRLNRRPGGAGSWWSQSHRPARRCLRAQPCLPTGRRLARRGWPVATAAGPHRSTARAVLPPAPAARLAGVPTAGAPLRGV
jgi:hypothetical protein